MKNKINAFLFINCLIFLFCGCSAISQLSTPKQNFIQSPQQVITSKNTVAIAGVGTEPYFQTALDELTDFLSINGIIIKQMDSSSKSRTVLIEKLAILGAKNLIYLTVDIGIGQVKDRLRVEYFDNQGKKLWQEETGSVIGFSGGGVIKKMINSMKKELKTHIDNNVSPNS